MSSPRADEAARQGTRSSALLVLVIGLALAFPGAAAMAKGAGSGKGAQGSHNSQPTTMPPAASAVQLEGMSISGTKISALNGAQMMATMPMSQTTMASPSTSPTVMRAATGSQTAPTLQFMVPTLMATSTQNPALAARATAMITNSRSSIKHSSMQKTSMPTTTSWASSGTVWPTADVASSASRSRGKSSSKPAALTTWPAVDTSASASSSTH